jgi:segregation and condensation protein A
MAAMLIEIKSRMLLPVKKATTAARPRTRAPSWCAACSSTSRSSSPPRLDRRAAAARARLPARAGHGRAVARAALPDVHPADLRAAWLEHPARAKLHQHHKITREQLSVREHMSLVLRGCRAGASSSSTSCSTRARRRRCWW